MQSADDCGSQGDDMINNKPGRMRATIDRLHLRDLNVTQPCRLSPEEVRVIAKRFPLVAGLVRFRPQAFEPSNAGSIDELQNGASSPPITVRSIVSPAARTFTTEQFRSPTLVSILPM